MKMPNRRIRPITVPITSMGDIAFLLIIFFMVCSDFVKESNVKWTKATAPDVHKIEKSRISVAIDKDGEIYLQGRRLPDPDALEAGVAALIQLRSSPDAKLIMFKCDRGVDKSVFEPVIGAIAEAGGTIVAVGEKEEKQ